MFRSEQHTAYPLTADNGYFLFYDSKYLNEEDVQTLDGILAVCEQEGKKFFMEIDSGWYMYSFFGNTDMKIGINDDGISTFCNWNAKYTKIKGVDVAQSLVDLGKNPAFVNAPNDDFAIGAADGTFIAGISGTWDEVQIKDAWGDGYAATKLPTYTVAGQQLQMSSYAGYKLVGVNSYSPNSAWANKFADWMTNEQNQSLRFSMRGQALQIQRHHLQVKWLSQRDFRHFRNRLNFQVFSVLEEPSGILQQTLEKL